jgi:hypothetical protein
MGFESWSSNRHTVIVVALHRWPVIPFARVVVVLAIVIFDLFRHRGSAVRARKPIVRDIGDETFTVEYVAAFGDDAVGVDFNYL